MTALSKDRNIRSRDGIDLVDPVAAGVNIFVGALVVLNATGFASPGTTALGLRARGVAQEAVDNTLGIDGALSAKLRKGIFSFENDGVDPVAGADVENTVYITDDQTVCKTDGAGTKSAAGKLVAFVDGVAWVQIG